MLLATRVRSQFERFANTARDECCVEFSNVFGEPSELWKWWKALSSRLGLGRAKLVLYFLIKHSEAEIHRRDENSFVWKLEIQNWMRQEIGKRKLFHIPVNVEDLRPISFLVVTHNSFITFAVTVMKVPFIRRQEYVERKQVREYYFAE